MTLTITLGTPHTQKAVPRMLFYALLLLFCCTNTSAQQAPQFSQYILNPFVVNPGITGAEDFIEVTAAYRNQWNGMEGAPSTATFSLNTPLHLLQGKLNARDGASFQGLGAFAYTDKAGPISQNGFYGSYAYHLGLNQDWYLSLGTFVGAVQHAYDDSDAILLQNPTDVSVYSYAQLGFDMSLGLYLYSDTFFTGIGVHHLLGNPVEEVNQQPTATNGNLQRTYNFLLGARFGSIDGIEVVPSTLLKHTANAPFQWDVSLKALYKGNIWAAISYRNQDAIVGMAGFRFWQHFMLSYSYDLATTAFKNDQSGSHEILLGYRFNLGNQKCSCSRYSL